MEKEPITILLERARAGDAEAREECYRRLYDELHRRARACMQEQPRDHTLEPRALVHEAYLRLARRDTGFANRLHFLAAAAKAMRWVLVDHARRRSARKRGGGNRPASVHSVVLSAGEPDVDVVELSDALDRLESFDPRAAHVVELRFFGGLNVKETAEVLGRSTRQVERDWESARAWLFGELR